MTKEKVLDHLRRSSLSIAQAKHLYKCNDLPKIISELRREGYGIAAMMGETGSIRYLLKSNV